MAFFSKLRSHHEYLDLSSSLRDDTTWKPGPLSSFRLSDIRVCAVEPAAGLLAIGTSEGTIRLFGSLPCSGSINVPEGRVAKCISFAQSISKLVCIGEFELVHCESLANDCIDTRCAKQAARMEFNLA
jgi:hypothetical protein